MLSTDFLVQTDADVVFSHKYVVRDIIQPLINERDVMMCGGNPHPMPALTFIEKSVNFTVNAYIPLRKLYNGGDNIFSVDGRLLAYKKELVKRIFIPEAEVTANDAFTYFCCLTFGYKYKFVESAKVFFRSPQTLKDHIKQNTRFMAMPIKMSKYFDPTLVLNAKKVSKKLYLKLFIKAFLKNPIHCFAIFLINLYIRLIFKSREKHLKAKWQIANTTKLLNSV